jgi:hypothetical protein
VCQPRPRTRLLREFRFSSMSLPCAINDLTRRTPVSQLHRRSQHTGLTIDGPTALNTLTVFGTTSCRYLSLYRLEV